MGKSVKSPERDERLAAALRENLKRRKTRARALDAEEANGSTEAVPNAQNPPKPSSVDEA